MLIVDAHCDTVTRIMKAGEKLHSNTGHLDIERMMKMGEYVQFLGAFISPAYKHMALQRAIQIIDRVYSEADENRGAMRICTNYSQIESALKDGMIAGVISIEGGEALQGDIAALRMLYRLGVRSICLTWNHRNEIADGIDCADSRGGLTPFGREVVREMNRLGMIVDVSHISEEGFYDVLRETSRPVIASHSNVRRLCNNRRNLSNEQIRAIERVNGVIGICFYRNFLVETGEASIKDVVRHIDYVCSLVGDTHVCIGSDFDGMDATPVDLKGVQDINMLFEELRKLNYKDEQIERIAGGNMMRVMRQVMGR